MIPFGPKLGNFLTDLYTTLFTVFTFIMNLLYFKFQNKTMYFRLYLI